MKIFFILLFLLFVLIPLSLFIWLLVYIIKKRNKTTFSDVSNDRIVKLNELKQSLKPWKPDDFYKISLLGHIIKGSTGFSMNRLSGHFLNEENEKLIAFTKGDISKFKIEQLIHFSNSIDDFIIKIEGINCVFYKNNNEIGHYILNRGLFQKKEKIGDFKITFLNTNFVDNHHNFKFNFVSGLNGEIKNPFNIEFDEFVPVHFNSGCPFYFENGEPTEFEKDILLCLLLLSRVGPWD